MYSTANLHSCWHANNDNMCPAPVLLFVPGMAFHRNPEDDPYLKQGGGEDDSDDDSGSEAEDLRLQENDILILAARNEDDVSYLEVGSRFFKFSVGS